MYPAQASMMPVQVALARFLETNGFTAVFANYPYWYLGTTPFRYLTGPILPVILIGLHKILSFLSLPVRQAGLFEVFFLLIAVCWILGAAGVYWLVRELKGKKRTAVLSVIFYLFGPIIPFLFRFSDGLYLITFSFLPFILALYSRFLQPPGTQKIRPRRKNDILLFLLIAFVMLLDLSIIPTMLLGMAAMFLAQVGWKKAEEKLKSSFVLLFFCFLVATLWYTPGYWLVSLTGPSLAGKGRLGVIFQLSKLLPTALAFALAIFSVRFFKRRHLLRDFSFYWLFIFGFLTLMRFIADPDFWLDWSSYNLELQMGMAIALGLGLSRIQANKKRMEANKRIIISVFCLLISVFWLFLANKYVLGTLQPDITQTVEHRIGRQLSEIAKPGERVFLSGTTAFWLNAFFDLPQVRGGVDQASVHPTWREAVWEMREGTEVEKSIRWLKELEVTYLVVHTQDSEEFYHDFTYPEKFEGASGLEKIYDEGGDRIYRLEDR